MEQALARRLIRVLASEGRTVDGEVTLEHSEQRWLMRPNATWQPGSYSLTVVSMIEDLAGNNIGQTFDVDLLERTPRRGESETVSVYFLVK